MTTGVTYTLRLMDEYGDGWSANSYVELTYGSERIVYGTLIAGYVGDIDFYIKPNIIPYLPTTEAPSFIDQYGIYFLIGFGGGFCIVALVAGIMQCSKSTKTMPKQPTK